MLAAREAAEQVAEFGEEGGTPRRRSLMEPWGAPGPRAIRSKLPGFGCSSDQPSGQGQVVDAAIQPDLVPAARSYR
ncbi:MAG: hypothetical protein ACRDOH_36670 [Streptosporangiaceae bacterium]